MRPGLLQSLLTPKRPLRQPQQMEQHVPYYRPSHLSLPLKPLPRRPGLAPDEIDDIDAFNFYNPCLFPPSPSTPVPHRQGTASRLEELPASSQETSPSAPPGHHQANITASIGSDRNLHGRNNGDDDQAATNSRSPSPPPRYTLEPQAPSLLHVRLKVNLPIWDASSRIPMASEETHVLPALGGMGDTQTQEEDYSMSDQGFKLDQDDGASQGGYQDREQAALRELWDLVDDLLGPGKALADGDANSIVSFVGNMEGRERPMGDEKSGRGERTSSYSTWWQAFRQGLVNLDM
ncbi:hypothetical protein N658DRAFT_527466 [Parathielavia hyrcaniae]|uniref:Uncharacterized protein n=1 Tax=Parathielavia hyrcaniae TaxID=113614 RepID=A0AAN6PS98_9PEZI|nr:hypothetical protein N658DRAFT_527466 [Parathielavia hyrcaniae]